MEKKQQTHRAGGLPGLVRVGGLLASLLATLLLVSCGTTQPWGYIWTDATTFATLTWNVTSGQGQVSGQYQHLSYQGIPFPLQTDPDTGGVAYTGTLAGNQVTLTLGGSFLGGFHLSGQQADDGSTLTLSGLDPSSGQTLHLTWVAVTSQQNGQVVQAFRAYGLVQLWLKQAQQDDRQETPWHDPNTQEIAIVQQAVQQNQDLLHQMQATTDQGTRCQLAQNYNRRVPILSQYVLSKDPLLSDTDALSAAWKAAGHTSIPTSPALAKLPLPWFLSSAAYQQAAARVLSDAGQMRAAFQQDQQTMHQLAQTDQQTARQIAALAPGCFYLPGA